MSKIFNLSMLNEARQTEVMTKASGSYTVDFRETNADDLARASKGYTNEALAVMVGRVVIMESFTETDSIGRRTFRLTPIPEQFTEAEAALMVGGSFSKTALSNRYVFLHDNGLFQYVCICLECGKAFAYDAPRHECNGRGCRECGATLTTEEARMGRVCIACAKARLGKIYSYHHRPNRSNPIFDRPDKRASVCHFGAEIEIAGTAHTYTTADAVALSGILNENPFKPFIEFERDASIDDGIECITAPTTWDGFAKRRNALKAFYDKAREQGGRFDRKNGLHFHIDREFFGGYDASIEASIFIELMVYKYFDFFSAISRREAGRFGYASKKDGVTNILTAARHSTYQDHSNAVNAGGGATIELRIFGGHIDCADDFFGALDITQALARWAKNATIAIAQKATPNDLVKYLKDPANTLKFIENAHSNRPRTDSGEAMMAGFITAIKAKLEAKEGV